MGNYEQLKQAVADVIKSNGNQEITGAILQNALLSIISTVGANSTFAGIATPKTNPGTPDQNIFYIAAQAGIYSNFEGAEIEAGITVFLWKGSAWLVSNILTISQEFGDGENIVTSQKAVTEEINKMELTIGIDGYSGLKLNRGYYINIDNYKISDRETSTNVAFKVNEGETIVYTGNYGGSCPAIIFYKGREILSTITKKDLGVDVTIEVIVPEGADSAVANSFNTDVNVVFKDSVGNKLKKIENNVSEQIKKLSNADNEIKNEIRTYSLSKKFKAYKDNDVNIEAIDKAILFAAFVPKDGYENDDICINALSAYYSNTSETNTPTRYDVWAYNVTKSEDVINWRNLNPETQARFQKIYLSSNSGQIYLIVDTEVLKNYNENGIYKAIIWSDRSLIINNFNLENNPFLSSAIWDEESLNDFSIVWFGTSIPAGGYPLIVGALLGCTVYNEAVGESLVRLGWGKNCIAEGDEIDKWGCSGTDTSAFNPTSNTITALAKSMSASKVEKQYLIDNLAHFEKITGGKLNRETYTDDVIMGYSYEEKLLKYLDNSIDDYTPVDLIVFDHGHNDLNPDGDPKWDTYEIDNRDKDNYWGAMNFLMDVIRKYNPHQMVCQISHYQGNVDYSANFYKAQQQFAEHWGIPFMELYKLTQMSTTEQFRTSGYWGYKDGLWHNNGFVFIDNGDGTYTTNQSCIIQYDFGNNGTYNQETQLFTTNVLEELPANTTARDIKTIDGITTCLLKPREMYMKDRLHPASDKSGNANKRIATLLAGWINSIFLVEKLSKFEYGKIN